MQPDALIMSDPGLIMLVRETFPAMEIHLSVQANAVNWATVKFWQQMGLSRIILSRELSIEEIAEIRQQVPDIELEILFTAHFVWPILVVVYYQVISINAIPIRVPVPMLVVGNIKYRKEKKTQSVILFITTNRSR